MDLLRGYFKDIRAGEVMLQFGVPPLGGSFDRGRRLNAELQTRYCSRRGFRIVKSNSTGTHRLKLNKLFLNFPKT